MQKTQGFTLIELIITILLMSIITVVVSTLFVQGLSAYNTGKQVINAYWQGEISLERMVRDIRAVRSSADITTASASQFVFTDTGGNSITYQLTGTSLMYNSQILADGIQSLTFGYYDKNGAVTAVIANIRYITISINVTQSNANLTFATAVYPRNLL